MLVLDLLWMVAKSISHHLRNHRMIQFPCKYLESPRPLKSGVITQNNGVIDPFLKGHGDSRYQQAVVSAMVLKWCGFGFRTHPQYRADGAESQRLAGQGGGYVWG